MEYLDSVPTWLHHVSFESRLGPTMIREITRRSAAEMLPLKSEDFRKFDGQVYIE